MRYEYVPSPKPSSSNTRPEPSVIDASPALAAAHAKRAWTALLAKNRAEAIHEGQLAVAYSNGNVGVQLVWSSILVDVGRTAEAIKILRRLRRSHDVEPRLELGIRNNLAYALLLLGGSFNLREADRLSKQALEANPGNFVLMGTRGSVLVRRGRLEEGLQLVRGAGALSDNDISRALNACIEAEALARMSSPVEAASALERAHTFDPECILLETSRRIVERCARG